MRAARAARAARVWYLTLCWGTLPPLVLGGIIENQNSDFYPALLVLANEVRIWFSMIPPGTGGSSVPVLFHPTKQCRVNIQKMQIPVLNLVLYTWLEKNKIHASPTHGAPALVWQFTLPGTRLRTMLHQPSCSAGAEFCSCAANLRIYYSKRSKRAAVYLHVVPWTIDSKQYLF